MRARVRVSACVRASLCVFCLFCVFVCSCVSCVLCVLCVCVFCVLHALFVVRCCAQASTNSEEAAAAEVHVKPDVRAAPTSAPGQTGLTPCRLCAASASRPMPDLFSHCATHNMQRRATCDAAAPRFNSHRCNAHRCNAHRCNAHRCNVAATQRGGVASAATCAPAGGPALRRDEPLPERRPHAGTHVRRL